MLKRIGLIGLAVVLVAGAGLLGAWWQGQKGSTAEAQAPAVNASQVITVVGQGTVKVQPDVAQVSVGVDTVADTVSDAVKESNTKMDAILKAVKALGIADKDIQTMNYSITVEQSTDVLPKPTGSAAGTKPQYRVSNMVNVTIRDLGKVGNVLDAVVEAGANNIWGVSFSVDDSKAAEAEARGKAVADAQSRALELANLAGVKLGSIVSISEVVGGNVVPMAAVERAYGGGGTSISPGEIEVSYQIQVAFYLER